jgi:hypothetical protein
MRGKLRVRATLRRLAPPLRRADVPARRLS